MAAFLDTQLDYIFFAYGLAFILLGAVCFSIARGQIGKAAGFGMLGAFGIIHGSSEWMDLAALIVDDSPNFVVVRTAVKAVSYLFLLEFARAEAVRLGVRLPGRWIHVALMLVLVALGLCYGEVTANIAARYGVGFVGAIGTALVMAVRARPLQQPQRLLVQLTGTGFALYAVAAGLIVPAAPFWPADVLNQTWFVHLTGVPIQLVRGVLACVLAMLIWAIWGRLLIKSVESDRYATYLRRHALATLAMLAVILTTGWILTNFLGGIYSRNVESESHGEIELLVSRLGGETGLAEAMVKALAGSPAVLPLLRPDSSAAERRHGQLVLNLNVEASQAMVGQILDRAGVVVASSDDREFALLGAPDASAMSYFKTAVAGTAGDEFLYDPASGDRIYVASRPVRGEDGAVVGVAVLKKSLNPLEASLLRFDRPFFLVNADGVVMLSNQLQMLNRRLWPRPGTTTLFHGPPASSLIGHEVIGSAWTTFDGARGYVLRAPVGHTGWSMVTVTPISALFANRLLGIVITLQFALTALMRFCSREHGVRDSVQLQRRQELQEAAKHLEHRATTDPLTGLYNRSKFDEAIAYELARAQRDRTPLALVVYDIDHFKSVNDAHGHLAGDRVLLQMAELVSRELRQTDLLARWGGEEFAVLLPNTGWEMACGVAEKLRLAIARAEFDEVGSMTCSFGVVERSVSDTAASLVARADNALYRAKLNGRNRVELASVEPIRSPSLTPL